MWEKENSWRYLKSGEAFLCICFPKDLRKQTKNKPTKTGWKFQHESDEKFVFFAVLKNLGSVRRQCQKREKLKWTTGENEQKIIQESGAGVYEKWQKEATKISFIFEFNWSKLYFVASVFPFFLPFLSLFFFLEKFFWRIKYCLGLLILNCSSFAIFLHLKTALNIWGKNTEDY